MTALILVMFVLVWPDLGRKLITFKVLSCWKLSSNLVDIVGESYDCIHSRPLTHIDYLSNMHVKFIIHK